MSNRRKLRRERARSPRDEGSGAAPVVTAFMWLCTDPNCEDGHDGYQSNEDEQSTP